MCVTPDLKLTTEDKRQYNKACGRHCNPLAECPGSSQMEISKSFSSNIELQTLPYTRTDGKSSKASIVTDYFFVKRYLFRKQLMSKKISFYQANNTFE